MEKIIDQSGDRKYFTQIPNIIVNHSTAYEQSLYLIMKRLAGENGVCYASLNWLAKKMGVHKYTVSATITKLLKRKWIKETEKTKVNGGYTRTFIILDLWKINVDNYEGGSEVSTNGGSKTDGGGSNIVGGGSQTDTKNIYNNIYNKKNASLKKSGKPYFRGMEMRTDKNGKLWCVPKDGGEWLEFAGEKSEITYE